MIEYLPEDVLEIIASIIGLGILWAFKKVFSSWSKQDTYEKIYEALESGVEEAQEQFVVWAKRAKQDGKLTKEERDQARELAKKTAYSLLTSDTSRKMWQELGTIGVNTLINKIVKARK